MELRTAIKQMTGKDPTDVQIQRMMAIAHALDIPPTDSMMSVLAMLDTYHGIYTDLPDRVSASVKNVSTQLNSMAAQASQKAKDDAEADMRKAVAQLVPTVEQAVGDAAKDAIRATQFGKSLITLALATIMVGLIFLAGLLVGSEIFQSAAGHDITWAYAFSLIKWGAFLGFAFPMLFAFSLFVLSDVDDYSHKPRHPVMGYGTLVLALTIPAFYIIPIMELIKKIH